MTTFSTILAIIGGLVILATTGGGLYAIASRAAWQETEKRLRTERDDYLSRLNFIEPRHRALEQQNELLLALHNPTEQLEDIGATGIETLQVVKAIKRLAEQIDRELYRPRGEPRD